MPHAARVGWLATVLVVAVRRPDSTRPRWFSRRRLRARLGLARARDRTARGRRRGRAVGLAVRLSRRELAVRDGCDVGELGVLEGARGLAARRALAVLLVRRDVEGDEEQEVGAEDAHAGEGGELLARALAGVGHPLEVGRGEVGVGGEVDEAWGLRQRVLCGVDGEMGGMEGLPRSMTNWMICRRVIHSFHQMRMPRALWK